jgi:hypothetical protein
MTKIVFWNVEHLSQAAVDIAAAAVRAEERRANKYQAAIAAAASSGGSGYGKITRATTRSATKSRASTASAASAAGGRFDRMESRAYHAVEQARSTAEKLKNKFELSQDLTISAPHVFFCEVLSSHPDAQSPLLGAAPAGGGTLCYTHYENGVSSAFTHCPITHGWYVGAPLPAAMTRVPKGIIIHGTRGLAAGQPVRFCFWHAPSGNNGQIVAQMANGLDVGGPPFVLFGDLNAEPGDYAPWLRPGVHIMRPPGGTRISGRTLDYAITNRPAWFNQCRPLYTEQQYPIKQRTGSDHMVMAFEIK